jgi:hypothetical protein
MRSQRQAPVAVILTTSKRNVSGPTRADAAGPEFQWDFGLAGFVTKHHKRVTP